MDGYRLRIGQYRAIYSLDMVVMTVENVAPRGAIY
jgi:mRNA-degrading endonuclease RelE of RelBE toxin-antitoxin system